MKMIAIIDYGMGNIHSVQKALESMGAKTIVTNDPQDIKTCDKAVLPGVGAFDDAMLELKKQNLIWALNEHIKSKKIFLGICLGMQLLFEESEEAKESRGLAILKGRVQRFKNKDSLKVPHIGWNQIKVVSQFPPEADQPLAEASEPVSQLNRQTDKWFDKLTIPRTIPSRVEGPANRQTKKCPLLKDIADGSYVYFCHSYYPQAKDKGIVAATTDYGINFSSVLWQNNIYGVQFHPEKSQEIGLKILKNFVDLC